MWWGAPLESLARFVLCGPCRAGSIGAAGWGSIGAAGWAATLAQVFGVYPAAMCSEPERVVHGSIVAACAHRLQFGRQLVEGYACVSEGRARKLSQRRRAPDWHVLGVGRVLATGGVHVEGRTGRSAELRIQRFNIGHNWADGLSLPQGCPAARILCIDTAKPP